MNLHLKIYFLIIISFQTVAKAQPSLPILPFNNYIYKVTNNDSINDLLKTQLERQQLNKNYHDSLLGILTNDRHWYLEDCLFSRSEGYINQNQMFGQRQVYNHKNFKHLFTGSEILAAFKKDSLHYLDTIVHSSFDIKEMNSNKWYFIEYKNLLIARLHFCDEPLKNEIFSNYIACNEYWYFFKR